LLSTFTITPVLASFLLPEDVSHAETVLVRWLRKVYEPVLRWALAHRISAVAIGVAVVALAGVLMPRLGGEFLPGLEGGNPLIRATMPPTRSLEAGGAVVR